jgi:hypothetical protein
MQVPPAPLTAIALFRGIIQRIAFWMTAYNVSGRLPYTINLPLMGRLGRIGQLLTRLTELVQAGRYTPRRQSGKRTPPAVRRPRQTGPLPREFGWLTTLLPETQETRGTLVFLLDQPETIALIKAAPTPLIRPLRSLCWALRLTPPPILARPKPASAPPAEPPPAKTEAPAPEPAPPAAPSAFVIDSSDPPKTA